jgi:heat shock protein HtpX
VFRLRLVLAAIVCVLFWALVGAVLGGLFRHPLGGFVCGLLLGSIYAVACSWAAPKFPGDVWDAKLLENINAPKLYEMLHTLSDRTGLALPTLYYTPSLDPNAFATAGRDGETAIVVTSGLTRSLEKDEVQAVMALMMARLATGAMPAWTTAATLAGVPVSVGQSWLRRPGFALPGKLLLTLTAFPAAALTRLVWDEKIVTASDYHAAHLTESAGSLARALQKMEAGLARDGADAGNPATVLLFAVPPLPPLTAGTSDPLWQRGLQAIPFPMPNAAARAARFAEVVPSYEEAPEEFRIY